MTVANPHRAAAAALAHLAHHLSRRSVQEYRAGADLRASVYRQSAEWHLAAARRRCDMAAALDARRAAA